MRLPSKQVPATGADGTPGAAQCFSSQPVSPSLALLAAVGITWGLGRIRPQWLASATGIAILCLALLTFAFAAACVKVFLAEDTQITGGRWLGLNASPHSLIGKPCWEGDRKVPVDTRVHTVVYSQPHAERPALLAVDENGQPRSDFIIVSEDEIPRNRFDMKGYDLILTIVQPLRVFGLRFDDRFPTSDLYAPRWHSKFHTTVYIYEHQQSQDDWRTREGR